MHFYSLGKGIWPFKNRKFLLQFSVLQYLPLLRACFRMLRYGSLVKEYSPLEYYNYPVLSLFPSIFDPQGPAVICGSVLLIVSVRTPFTYVTKTVKTNDHMWCPSLVGH